MLRHSNPWSSCEAEELGEELEEEAREAAKLQERTARLEFEQRWWRTLAEVVAEDAESEDDPNVSLTDVRLHASSYCGARSSNSALSTPRLEADPHGSPDSDAEPAPHALHWKPWRGDAERDVFADDSDESDTGDGFRLALRLRRLAGAQARSCGVAGPFADAAERLRSAGRSQGVVDWQSPPLPMAA